MEELSPETSGPETSDGTRDSAGGNIYRIVSRLFDNRPLGGAHHAVYISFICVYASFLYCVLCVVVHLHPRGAVCSEPRQQGGLMYRKGCVVVQLFLPRVVHGGHWCHRVLVSGLFIADRIVDH